MAKTKRNRNIARNERANQLKAEIRLDPNRVLAYIPESFVSHKTALRSFKLTENDLQHLDHVAVIGEKRGQEGIFYPLGEIRALAVNKQDQNQLDEKMIPESIISMQIPKNHFDNNYLERFRSFGIKGTRSGSKGTFYTEEVIDRELGLKVIRPDMIEGKDYIKEKSVPDDMRAMLEPPVLCIWSGCSFGSMEACYLGSQVSAILSKYCLQDVRRKSKRYSKLPPRAGELPPSLEELPSGSGAMSKRSCELPPVNLLPISEDRSFKSGDLSLRSGDLSFGSGDLSFRVGDLSPRPEELFLTLGDISPRPGHLPLRPGDNSSWPGHSPTLGNLSPRAEDLSSRPEDLSLRPGNQETCVPDQEDRLPDQEDYLPDQEDCLPDQEDCLPDQEECLPDQ